VQIDWIDMATKISIGVVTGLFVAYGTAKYALNRFYTEKWWEKRLNAFLEVTEHAYKIKRAESYFLAVLDSQRSQDESFKSLSKDEEEKLRVEREESIKEITRISHLASFTLSDRAHYALKKYVGEHDKIFPSWWYDALTAEEATEKSSEIIDVLFDELITEAKTSLNLTKQKV
jgi:hypothetical protein